MKNALLTDILPKPAPPGATKGVLVTTSDYGPDAYEFANGKPITLWGIRYGGMWGERAHSSPGATLEGRCRAG